jgi:hypothetical protein
VYIPKIYNFPIICWVGAFETLTICWLWLLIKNSARWFYDSYFDKLWITVSLALGGEVHVYVYTLTKHMVEQKSTFSDQTFGQGEHINRGISTVCVQHRKSPSFVLPYASPRTGIRGEAEPKVHLILHCSRTDATSTGWVRRIYQHLLSPPCTIRTQEASQQLPNFCTVSRTKIMTTIDTVPL